MIGRFARGGYSEHGGEKSFSQHVDRICLHRGRPLL